MFFKIYLFYLSFSIFAHTASALLVCNDTFPNTASKAFNGVGIQEQKELLDEVGASLGLDLSTLKLVQGESGESPVYSSTYDSIKFSINDSIDSAVVIFTHEYTHAIFERYMSASSGSWRRLRERSSSIRKEIDSLYVSVNKQPNTLEQDKVLYKIKQLRKEETTLTNQLYFMNAYHEFIADALPTIIYQDKKIMMTSVASLSLSQGGDAQLSLRWRSFENCFDENEHKIWIDQVNRIQSLVGYYNPYDLLAPLRAHLGSIFLKKIKNLTDLKNNLPIILSALKSDFEQRIDLVSEDSSKIDADEMNEALLKLLANI